jgi:two-component system OmpR family response regulator
MNPATVNKLRILIVEDQPIARDILADLLRMAGYEPISAATGEQALLTLVRERDRIDGLFTELELPGLVDGTIVVEEFRSQRPSGQVVFASRYEDAGRRCAERTAFVRSPVSPPKVVEAFAGLMGRAETVARLRRARIASKQSSPRAGQVKEQLKASI